MSKDSKRSNSERLKYGICLNDECSLCKSKQIQSVPMRKELICSECGKELRECPPPKKKSKTPIAIIIATIIIAIGIGLFFVLYDKKEDSIEPIIVPNDIIITDTIKSETITNANITPAENSIVEDEPKTVDTIKNTATGILFLLSVALDGYNLIYPATLNLCITNHQPL